jgi:dTDP-4-amino-4,6-dideoxygalactose transaminase
VRALQAAGIQTSLHYPCVADFTAFKDPPTGGLDVTRSFAERAITLPLYPALTESQVDEIVSVIRDCAG